MDFAIGIIHSNSSDKEFNRKRYFPKLSDKRINIKEKILSEY